MKVTVNIKGINEVADFFKNMPDEFNYKFLVSAHKTALKPFQTEAKRRAPILGSSRTTRGRTKVTSRYSSRTHEKGNLRDSISMGVIKSARTNAGVWCGPQASVFGNKKYDAYYAHMVEFGHFIKKRRSKKYTTAYGDKILRWYKGEDVGDTWVPPKPFMRPAFDETKEIVASGLQDIYINKIKRYVTKHGGR